MRTGSFARRSRLARRAGPRPIRPPVRLVSLTGEVNGFGPDLWGGQRAGFTGTHQGEYRGLAPTGKSVTYNEIFVVRFAGSRIAEIWGVVDVLSQMKQLGMIPA
jgi:hypothetical protein